MRLFYRKDRNVWYVELERGNVRSLKTGDKLTAKQLYRKMKKAHLEDRLIIGGKANAMKLSKFIALHEKNYPHLSENTLAA